MRRLFQGFWCSVSIRIRFLKHLHYPMYKGGFETIFTKSRANDALYQWKFTEHDVIED